MPAPVRTMPFRRLLGACAGLLLSLVVAGPVLAAGPVAPPTSQDVMMSGAQAAGSGTGIVPPVTLLPTTLQGIDVSHWQGHIGWNRVAAAGIDFAIAKATQGGWKVDPWYARNAVRARSQGIRFTAYHFAQPDPRSGSAVRQADFFLRHAALRASDLLPALDLERSGGLGPTALRRWVLDWLNRVYTRIGVKAIVYSNPGFWRGQMADTMTIARSGYEVLWLAHYDTQYPSVPAQRWDGHGWTIWQWTECGHVTGVYGCVDRDALRGTLLKDLTIAHLRGRATN